jgi:predicted RNA binding protein YcfA (HicA-like mRNA interferase family)
MSAQHLRNIALRDYLKFLEYIGCKLIRERGGHLHYSRKDLARPITVQSHIDPVPEFIIKNHLRILNMSRKDFLDQFYLM